MRGDIILRPESADLSPGGEENSSSSDVTLISVADPGLEPA
jgi:hypothetical protein